MTGAGLEELLMELLEVPEEDAEPEEDAPCDCTCRTTVVLTIFWRGCALAAVWAFDPRAGSPPWDICQARPAPIPRVAALASAAILVVSLSVDSRRRR